MQNQIKADSGSIDTKETVLHQSCSWVKCADGLRVYSPILRRSTLIKNGIPDRVIQLLELLRRGLPEDKLERVISERSGLSPNETNLILKTLQDAGMIYSSSSNENEFLDDGSGQFDRQLRFLRNFEKEGYTVNEIQDHIEQAKVAIVGLGGMGGWIALQCIRIGIKNLVVIDSGVVQRSDLARNILFTSADIGRSKIVAAQNTLTMIEEKLVFDGRSTHLHDPEDLKGAIRDVNLVFNSLAYAPGLEREALVVDFAARSQNIPCLHFTSAAIGPISLQGSPCYRCALRSVGQLYFGRDLLRPVHSDLVDAGHWLPAFAPIQALSASLAVWEGVKYIAGIAGSLHSRVAELDILDYTSHRLIEVRVMADCECQVTFRSPTQDID